MRTRQFNLKVKYLPWDYDFGEIKPKWSKWYNGFCFWKWHHFIDTAEMYPFSKAETQVYWKNYWWMMYKKNRNKLIIASKICVSPKGIGATN